MHLAYEVFQTFTSLLLVGQHTQKHVKKIHNINIVHCPSVYMYLDT